jgi:antitoxin ParD1/3/4
MTQRSIRQAGPIEEAKLQALKQAADKGWSDIEAGRYTDVDDDQLEDYVARLGELKASAKYPAPDASTKGIPSEPSKGIPATVAVPATVGTLIGSPRRHHDYAS